MRRTFIGLFLTLSVLPSIALAQSTAITRRDGFLMVWNSIRRATVENREPYFTDVSAGAPGEDAITYAKYRGLLDDDDPAFHPDDPLHLEDALLWLYRTRSVDDISAITSDNLATLLGKYPLPGIEFSSAYEGAPRVVDREVTEEELTNLMRVLDDELLNEVHEASLYSEKFQGKGTAFGESFNMNDLTAAHRTFPYNTLVKVTNVANGKSVTVRVNDRGPYVEGRDMDLSLAAFTTIEDRSKGILHATFQRLGDATLVGQCDDSDTRRAIRVTKGVHLIGGVPVTLPLGKDLVFRSTKTIVLRSVRYPDGNLTYIEDWILPGESHPFTPSVAGEYVFTVGSREGRARELRMTVTECH